LDTADTDTVGDTDSDVTLLTPLGSPGVLDDVVVLTVLGTVTDGEDGVIHLSSALGGGDDTTGVLMEGWLVSLNTNGDWLLGNGSLKLIWGVLWNILRLGDLNLTFGLVVLAVEEWGLGSVWVVGLGLHGVALGVLEGSVWHTTVATKVAIEVGAVNELLFGEGDEVASGEEMSTFHSTGGRERPAGTALTLVLDWGNGTLGSPVDGGWDVLDIEVGDVLLGLESLVEVTVH